MTQSTGQSADIQRVSNKPVHAIRYGSIRAAIWKNVVDLGANSRPVYNVTLSRSYRDGDTWKDSSSFGQDDLLVLAKAADAAHTWIFAQRNQDSFGVK